MNSSKLRTAIAHILLFTALAKAAAPTSPHSAGCGKPLPRGLVPGGASVNLTLYSPQGGGQRRYLVHLPAHFSSKNDRPAPAVLACHGFGQSTTSLEEMSGLSDGGVAGELGYVAVYPEGVNVGLA
jgi:poly(3-hydroxybutyrate) depolymerase